MSKYYLLGIAVIGLIGARLYTGDNTFCAAIVVLSYNLIREYLP